MQRTYIGGHKHTQHAIDGSGRIAPCFREEPPTAFLINKTKFLRYTNRGYSSSQSDSPCLETQLGYKLVGSSGKFRSLS